MKPQDRIIVALDSDSLAQAETWVKTLCPSVRRFKVGKELFTQCGPDAIRMVHDHGGLVFLDLKYHDIPNTVAKAVAAAQRLGVWMLNVHASGGLRMMKAARDALGPGLEDRPILIAVTLLTSLSSEELKQELGVSRTVESQIVALAALAKKAGLDGVVASAPETTAIKQSVGSDFIVVTPGVRPAGSDKGDQVRVATPRSAIESGSDFLVIGRPITSSDDLRLACDRLINSI